MALCFFSLYRIYSEQFLLCATPPTFLNGFWPNFHRSFVIKCPGAYCWGVLWLDNIWPNYGPLFYFLYRIYSEQFLLCTTPPTFLNGFWPNFHRSFEALSSSALAYIVGILWLDNIWPNYGPLFFSLSRIYSEQFLLCATRSNSSYISQRFLTKLSQKLFHQVPWGILSGFCDCIIFDLIMALCFFSLYRIYSEQFLLCATPPTFLNGFWPNFHWSFVIKCPGAYCWGFVIE
jgi:hypothetical protein